MDADTWDRRYAGAELVWSAEPNRFVAAEFADLPPGRVLDVASGEGRNALWLAGLGWRVTAVDFSGVAVAKGRALAQAQGRQVEWVVADVVRGYRPEPASFDAVLIAYLHLPPDEFAAVLRHAAAAVAPGGILLVVGHDVTNLTEGTGGPQDAERLYDPATITAALPGWDIGRAERARRPVTTDGGTRDAIDTVVRARRPGRASAVPEQSGDAAPNGR